ncbi:hypothetical protein [Variovorax sp. UC122_21]|uniref:hypothetical protein n=1 Tax=Variovorax sp. UC122_21 TaxID=3374554 RepID=UPI00375841CD
MNPLRRGGAGARLSMRKGVASGPAPLDAIPSAPAPGDYAAFLRTTLPRQAKNVASHRFGDERVWLKKAGPRHGKWGYRVMAAVARMARLDIIKPVPNPGGEAAIATEARRLRQLAAAGLRVPRVLAEQADGLLISDLGASGRGTVVLQERLDQAATAGPAALLAVWREGLAAIATVHAHGQHLSQAFDRNLVQCPDGVIGYIDFEDDPSEVMTLAECQARDWLSYLHSTAMMLEAAAPMPPASTGMRRWPR